MGSSFPCIQQQQPVLFQAHSQAVELCSDCAALQPKVSQGLGAGNGKGHGQPAMVSNNFTLSCSMNLVCSLQYAWQAITDT
jgi:hypothetical protein